VSKARYYLLFNKIDLLEISEDDDGDILEFLNYQRQVRTIRIRTNHFFSFFSKITHTSLYNLLIVLYMINAFN